MCSESVIAHERMRFTTMTPQQLLTRLYRITKLEKLDGYIQMAKELGYNSLWKAAVDKKNGLARSNTSISVTVNVTENKKIEKQELTIVKEIEFRRSLDF